MSIQFGASRTFGALGGGRSQCSLWWQPSRRSSHEATPPEPWKPDLSSIARGQPALAVGGTPAIASHAAAGPEGTRAGSRTRAAFCVQRHVEALLASHRGPGWAAFARAGSVPYH